MNSISAVSGSVSRLALREWIELFVFLITGLRVCDRLTRDLSISVREADKLKKLMLLFDTKTSMKTRYYIYA